MRKFGWVAALACGVGAGCGPDGASGEDLGEAVFHDGSAGDAGDGGVRIWSDVTAPRSDGSPRGGGAAGGSRDATSGADASDETSIDASADDGGADGASRNADVRSDGAHAVDAKTDVRRDVDASAPATDAMRSDVTKDAKGTSRDVRADQSIVDGGTPRDADGGAIDAPGIEDAVGADGSSDDADTGSTSDAGERDGSDVSTADHLLITEIVTRPGGAEMIEIVNPTAQDVDLSGYWLSDSHLYYSVVWGTFATASGSDFAARFPDGAAIAPGQYVVIALGNASGGTQSFAATYGRLPDFELRPTANGAIDDETVPNMLGEGGGAIGANASLTDGGEPVVLFFYREGDLVSDVDYVFYGAQSVSNAVVDKTGLTSGSSAYLADTAAGAQRTAAAPGETGALHRCHYAELGESAPPGNGLTSHDETSEDMATAFRATASADERTPGGPAPSSVCTNAVRR
jgi:hypothetical protein